MILASRKWILAAGAAALLSSQAALAEPVNTVPSVDPLVAVSLFGSQESRAAICGTGNACTLPAGMNAATAATSAAALQPPPPDHPYGLDVAGLVMLFFVPVAITLAIALEGNNSQPFSPD